MMMMMMMMMMTMMILIMTIVKDFHSVQLRKLFSLDFQNATESLWKIPAGPTYDIDMADISSLDKEYRYRIDYKT